jgi:7-keto-8-aminopelargonate synthetase-like enzyme
VNASAAKLKQAGILASLAAYPSRPRKNGGLRISLSRHLEIEDNDYPVGRLAAVL